MGYAAREEEKLYVTFKSPDDIIDFVRTCRKYDDAIDVGNERRHTDAKSFLGMLLMPCGEPLSILFHCSDNADNYSRFLNDISQKYDIKVVPVS